MNVLGLGRIAGSDGWKNEGVYQLRSPLGRKMSADKERLANSEECLAMVREALERHGVVMDHCPPMLYDAGIHNLFVWGIEAGRECLRKHGEQPQEHQVKCISDWIENHQSIKR